MTSNLTILSATYADAEKKSAIITTQERGAIAFAMTDRPNLWQAMMLWAETPGNVIADVPLQDLKDRLIDHVSDRFEAALAQGMTYAGKTLQIREQDQINISAMGSEARWAIAADAAWPSNFAWRMADDSFLALPTAQSMVALGEAAKAEVFRLRLVKWAHVDAINALNSAAAVAAYDIETGWNG